MVSYIFNLTIYEYMYLFHFSKINTVYTRLWKTTGEGKKYFFGVI